MCEVVLCDSYRLASEENKYLRGKVTRLEEQLTEASNTEHIEDLRTEVRYLEDRNREHVTRWEFQSKTVSDQANRIGELGKQLADASAFIDALKKENEAFRIDREKMKVKMDRLSLSVTKLIRIRGILDEP